MAEPKKRMTSTRSGNRQSHDAIKAKSTLLCSNCKQANLPHHVCENCGYYRGKKVIELKKEKVEEKAIKEELKDE